MKVENGFVKITGASDLEDSSMAAGICATFNYPIAMDLFRYFNKNDNYNYQRCDNSKYLFSRDQAICLTAGLKTQGFDAKFIGADRINGKDILSPSDKGHIKRCQGLKASWFEDAWFWAELAFSAKVKPLDELNQLLCKMMIADPKFIKWYCRNNPQWEQSLKNYWCENDGAWRNEPELCAQMIYKINERIK